MRLIIGMAFFMSFMATQAMADCGMNSICKYDRVNFGEYTGTAAEVFNNGKVKIDVDGYSGYSFRRTDQLGKGVKCFGGVCRNDRVNFGDYVGTADEVFSNARVKIDVDGYTGFSYREVGQLGTGVKCFDGICQNDRVNFGDYVGRAAEVFNNGKVKIDVDGYSGYSYRSTSELGRGYRCIENLCQGDRVNFGSYVGTVEEVFTNGKVKIDVDGYSGYSYRMAIDLGYEIDCSTGSQYCHCIE